MQPFTDPETLWLDVTNVALGLITLACLLVVGNAILREVLVRVRNRVLARSDDHAMVTPGLGLTMADGGEPIKSLKNVFPIRYVRHSSSVPPDDEDDQPNIIRSIN